MKTLHQELTNGQMKKLRSQIDFLESKLLKYHFSNHTAKVIELSTAISKITKQVVKAEQGGTK